MAEYKSDINTDTPRKRKLRELYLAEKQGNRELKKQLFQTGKAPEELDANNDKLLANYYDVLESLSQAEILFRENIIKLKDKDKAKNELSLLQQDFEEKLGNIDKLDLELSSKDVTNIKKKLIRKDIH